MGPHRAALRRNSHIGEVGLVQQHRQGAQQTGLKTIYFRQPERIIALWDFKLLPDDCATADKIAGRLRIVTSPWLFWSISISFAVFSGDEMSEKAVDHQLSLTVL